MPGVPLSTTAGCTAEVRTAKVGTMPHRKTAFRGGSFAERMPRRTVILAAKVVPGVQMSHEAYSPEADW